MSGLVTTGTVNIVGTGGILEGDLHDANVNVNLDSALYFSGGGSTGGLSNDNKNVVTMGDNDLVTTGSLSMSIWVKPQAAADGGTVYGAQIIGKQVNYNANTLGYGLYWAHDSRRFYFNIGDGSNGDRLNSAVLAEDEWYHVVGTYNSSTKAMVLWINGVSVDTGTATSCGNLSTSNSNHLKLGGNGSNATDGDAYFTGYIADARMYSYVFSETHVKDAGAKIHVNDPMNDSNYGLTAMWACNEGTSHTIADGHDAGTEYDGAYQRNGSNYSTDIWKGDQFSVNVHDNSTTTDGTFTVTRGKVEGLALTHLNFDGTDDLVTVSDFDLYNSATQGSFSIWVNPDTVSGNQYIATKYDTTGGGNREFQLYLSSANAKWNVQHDKSNHDANHAATGSSSLVADEWYHLCGTFSTTNGQKIYVNGVLDGTATTAITDAIDDTTSNLMFGANQSSSPTTFFNGQIRDAKSFGHELSADQVASLYSGSYNVTPEHWWKMDDGGAHASGSATVEDYGTGTDADGTKSGAGWQNGTLNLDGNLTIAATGSLSAPRGNMTLAGTVKAFENAGTFTHNNGTVVFDNGADVAQSIQDDESASTTFYNLTHNRAASSYHLYIKGDITVENTLLNQSGYLTLYGPNTLTLGTTTSAATCTWTSSGLRFDSNTSGNASKVHGVSTLYPALQSSNDWDWDSGGADKYIEIKNLNFDPDITTNEGPTNIKLTGDCEFDAVTVSANDTLDLNGKRMECSGTLTVSGNADYGGGLLLANRFDIGGVNTNEEGTDFIANSSGSPVHTFSSSSFVGDTKTNFLFNGTADVNANHSGFLGNMYIANGKIDAKGHHYGTNFTVATGATYDTEAKNINILGDLTVSGGLIGKSCAVFNSDDGTSNGNYITAGNSSNSDDWTNMSVEAWIKLDHLGRQSSESTFFSRGSNAVPKFGLYSGKLRMYGGSSSKAIGGTGSNGDISIQETLVTGIWYHVACSYNNSTGAAKLYVNGRLDCEATIDAGMLVADVGASCIGAQSTGNRHFDGTMGKISVWNHELTEDEIRELMFYTGAEMQAATNFSSNKNDCKFFYNFDEASGDTIVDSGPGGNNADWDLKGSHTGLTTGMTSSGALWATTGLMMVADDSSNHGETGTTPNISSLSTLIFSKNGTQQFNFLHNDIIGNIQVDANSTTELYCHDDGGGTIQVYGNFVINGILKPEATSGTSSNTNIRMRTGDKTITIGNATTGVASLYRMTLSHPSGTLTLPYSYHKRIICDGNGTTVQGSTLRITEELEVQNGHTYNSSAANLEFKVMDLHNGSTVDLSGSFINQKPAHTDGAISFGASATITMTNKSGRGVAILGNDTGGTNTDVNMPAAGDWFMEGGGQGGKPAIQDCRMLSGSDLTVIGSTLGLTFEDNTANVHQFTQNIDTNHLLDSDPTDDDDVSLPRPTLDNSLQLTGGD